MRINQVQAGLNKDPEGGRASGMSSRLACGASGFRPPQSKESGLRQDLGSTAMAYLCLEEPVAEGDMKKKPSSVRLPCVIGSGDVVGFPRPRV